MASSAMSLKCSMKGSSSARRGAGSLSINGPHWQLSAKRLAKQQSVRAGLLVRSFATSSCVITCQRHVCCWHAGHSSQHQPVSNQPSSLRSDLLLRTKSCQTWSWEINNYRRFFHRQNFPRGMGVHVEHGSGVAIACANDST